MQKTAYVSGFCPFLEEEVTIRATFTRYAPLGTIPQASPDKNLCEYGGECNLDPDNDCPVLTRTFLWNEL